MTRRELLDSAACLVGVLATRASAATTDDFDFIPALQAAVAIKAKKISSRELTQRTFARLDKFNPKLNAFTYQLRDQALAQLFVIRFSPDMALQGRKKLFTDLGGDCTPSKSIAPCPLTPQGEV